MDTKRTGQPSLNVNEEQLLAFVRAMIGGEVGPENDQNRLPPGPWDPVARAALAQLRFLGPQLVVNAAPEARIGVFQSMLRKHPEIFDALGRAPTFGDEVALNPQPLPPRAAFLIASAQAVIRRAELLQEISDAMSHDGSQQGIVIVGSYTGRFSHDWCATGFKLRWPSPGPRPHWFPHELDGIDLLVVATQFDQAANAVFGQELREHLTKASAKFTEVGMSRLQTLMDEPLTT